jgi:2-dehydropantoate 2-reductase
MRLLVVGAGATGGYFGARLAQAGRDVTFLVRPARAAELRAHGLRIVSPHDDVTLAPRLVTAGQIEQPYDAVLLAVKGYQLDAAIDDMAAAVGPRTMILPVLNGMRHMELLARRFDTHNLIGCILKVAAVLDGQGRIVQLSALQELAYGELDGSRSQRILELDAYMRGAGFDARISADIRREMWEKWTLLCALGGITCLMRGTIGEVQAAAGGTAFALALLEEIVSIVRAVGVAPSPEFLAAARVQLTAAGSPLTSSMYRDLQQGAPIEADQIVGDLLQRAAGTGISAVRLNAVYTHLSVYQNRLRTAAAAAPGAGA